MVRKVLRKLKSKDGKVLFENMISLASIQLVGLLLPLITLPYVVRVLGFSNYGIIALASSLVAYFQSFTDYSFRITATRDVTVHKHSISRLNVIFSKVIIVRTIFLALSLLVIAIIITTYPPFYEQRLVFLYASISLAGYVLFPEWFFQGIEKMRYITFLNIGVRILFTLGIFIFIKEPDDYWKYPLLNSLGQVIAGAVGVYVLFKKYGIRFIWLGVRPVVQTIKQNFAVFINQFLPTLYNNTTTFLLGLIMGNFAIGVFDATRKVVELGVTLQNVVSRVFFPYLNRKRRAFTKYKKSMMVIGIGTMLTPIIFYPVIKWYLQLTYDDAFTIIVILSIGTFFTAIYDIFGLNYFIVRRLDSVVAKNTMVAAMLGGILAIPLIYLFGIIGAALNITLARSVMAMGLWYKYQQQVAAT